MADDALVFACRHIGDSDETVTAELSGARDLAWFNPDTEVAVSGGHFGTGWAPFYGPEVSNG